MNDKIISAEELFGKHFNGLHYDDITPKRIENYALDFAKHHLEAQLQAILNNAKSVITDWGYNSYVDKDSIINAYNLNNVK